MTPPKFRVWDGEEMHLPDTDTRLVFDQNGLWELRRLHGPEPVSSWDFVGDVVASSAWKNSVLMQYTGLTDAEGTEVYQGDIVDLDNPHTPAPEAWRGIVRIGEYTLEHGDLDLTLRGVYLEVPSLEDVQMTVSKEAWDDATVVGNIYENSSRLEQEPAA